MDFITWPWVERKFCLECLIYTAKGYWNGAYCRQIASARRTFNGGQWRFLLCVWRFHLDVIGIFARRNSQCCQCTALAGTNGANDMRYPPSKVLPFYGFSFYCAPLCFVSRSHTALHCLQENVPKVRLLLVDGCFRRRSKPCLHDV